MKFPGKLKIWGSFCAGIAVLVAFALPSYRQGEASIAGRTAEDFSMEMNGKPMKLSGYRGKVVVLNFWASWCPPCVAETPSLNNLQTRIEQRGGLVLGVDVDEDPQAYQKFLTVHGVVFPTWRDPSVKGTTSQVALDYGTSVYPETYVIDRRGKITRKIIGEQQWDSPEMTAYFDALLAEK
jgi:cytochrome c biogenesis protein CcmG, thiol:disulfide interchange protein DsbE